MMKVGVTINRPPRDRRIAFIRSPDNIPSSCCRRQCAAQAGALDLNAEHRQMVSAAGNLLRPRLHILPKN